ncbi:hypothetical protein SAMN05421688_1748 [Poseidonocella pacifica]|uniref:Uncharacterized protein n=1 Tax=Poseidonocella pacifica TaxID=871651 RepID=A0A1I0WUX8_9RHOB|nr:hypothetical protein [Poseidonocella pacifica]SFA91826.1 hypothetical protein SAMN05421688_1748 [Poseidonocella pacifica]
MRRLASCAILLGLMAGPGVADTPPRCALLGQMAVSSWLEMLGALSGTDSTTADPIIARLDGLTGIYGALSCDAAQLQEAMDCLLTQSGNIRADALARQCMQQSGMTEQN